MEKTVSPLTSTWGDDAVNVFNNLYFSFIKCDNVFMKSPNCILTAMEINLFVVIELFPLSATPYL